MKILVSSIALAGIILGSNVFAGDTMSQTTMTKHQAMKDCIEQQKTADVAMSKAQMKRMCKDKLKAQKASGDMPEHPPSDAPHN